MLLLIDVYILKWLRGRASDYRLREPGFESCAAVLKPSLCKYVYTKSNTYHIL